MATDKLLEKLNEQFNNELQSAYIYLGMAAYFSSENMNGFAHFMNEQAKEEYEHAMKFYKFINDMDGRVLPQALEAPKNDYSSFLEAFEEALAHEKKITAKIYELLDMALEEKCHATAHFLQWFIEEQLEEENSIKDIIFVLKGIDGNFNGLYLYDKELGQR
jgi:ferritin